MFLNFPVFAAMMLDPGVDRDLETCCGDNQNEPKEGHFIPMCHAVVFHLTDY